MFEGDMTILDRDNNFSLEKCRSISIELQTRFLKLKSGESSGPEFAALSMTAKRNFDLVVEARRVINGESQYDKSRLTTELNTSINEFEYDLIVCERTLPSSK
ncbi:MAG: hypothetical protein ACRC3J_04995 [Culicoidibacterales bacterium]